MFVLSVADSNRDANRLTQFLLEQQPRATTLVTTYLRKSSHNWLSYHFWLVSLVRWSLARCSLWNAWCKRILLSWYSPRIWRASRFSAICCALLKCQWREQIQVCLLILILMQCGTHILLLQQVKHGSLISCLRCISRLRWFLPSDILRQDDCVFYLYLGHSDHLSHGRRSNEPV